MPPGLSPMHVLVIFVVALVVLGPDKMPDAARKAAGVLGEARRWAASMSEDLHSTDATPPSSEADHASSSETEPS